MNFHNDDNESDDGLSDGDCEVDNQDLRQAPHEEVEANDINENIMDNGHNHEELQWANEEMNDESITDLVAAYIARLKNKSIPASLTEDTVQELKNPS